MKRPAPAVILALLVLSVLAACAHTGKVHTARETVRFEGMEFRVGSMERRFLPTTVAGAVVSPEGVFVIVELSVRNGYTSPVPVQFQPRFTLVDSRGRVHAPLEETVTPPKGPGGELAPQTQYVKRLVFDVPEGSWRLRVFTPVIVRSGPEGTIQGRFFFFDLG